MRKFFLVFIFLIVLAVPLVGVHAQLSGALDNLNKAVGPGSHPSNIKNRSTPARGVFILYKKFIEFNQSKK
jgi:hypothetical protein